MPNSEYMKSFQSRIKTHVQKNSSLSVSRLKEKCGYHGTNYGTFKSALKQITKTEASLKTSINTSLSNLYKLKDDASNQYHLQKLNYIKKKQEIETTYNIKVSTHRDVHNEIVGMKNAICNRKNEIHVNLEWEQYERYVEQVLHRGEKSWHNLSNMSEMYSEVVSMFRHTNPLPELSDEFRADTFLRLDDLADELAQLEL